MGKPSEGPLWSRVSQSRFRVDKRQSKISLNGLFLTQVKKALKSIRSSALFIWRLTLIRHLTHLFLASQQRNLRNHALSMARTVKTLRFGFNFGHQHQQLLNFSPFKQMPPSLAVTRYAHGLALMTEYFQKINAKLLFNMRYQLSNNE